MKKNKIIISYFVCGLLVNLIVFVLTINMGTLIYLGFTLSTSICFGFSIVGFEISKLYLKK